MAQSGSFPTLTARVVDTIREDIINCRLQPGTVIRDHELAARYHVSTSPIREAIAQMVTEHLIVVLPNKTKYVSPLDMKSVQDFVEFHWILLRAALEFAGPKLDAAALADMAEAQRRIAENFESGDPEEFIPLVRVFYECLHRAGGNKEIRRQLIQNFPWFRRTLFLMRQDYRVIYLEGTAEIIKHLMRGDVDAAVSAQDEMYRRFSDLVSGLDLSRVP